MQRCLLLLLLVLVVLCQLPDLSQSAAWQAKSGWQAKQSKGRCRHLCMSNSLGNSCSDDLQTPQLQSATIFILTLHFKRIAVKLFELQDLQLASVISVTNRGKSEMSWQIFSHESFEGFQWQEWRCQQNGLFVRINICMSVMTLCLHCICVRQTVFCSDVKPSAF